jgi:hypothetical protein
MGVKSIAIEFLPYNKLLKLEKKIFIGINLKNYLLIHLFIKR